MAIEVGQQLLHYRLIEKIGEGGMGVVWKALDTTLNREVAIKLLPAVVAQDGDRLARLDREAKLLASLNHPNIASVYGLHEDGTSTGSVRFLVMEFVEGEDLLERLNRGRMKVEDALRVARQIADALQSAHESGVVHRDLKPANILMTPDGKAKVLDFGLAKAFESDPSSSVNPSMSPTLTSAGTVAGVILGTAGYMSPEQARGHSADKRSDLWAFGVVLYEMLSGRRAFHGDTVSDTLASVLKLEPDWDVLPAGLPRGVTRLLRRCLQKDPQQRLHDIADARIEIDEALAAPLDTIAEKSGAQPAPARARWLLTVVLAGLALVGGLMIGRRLAPEAPDPPVRRFFLPIEASEDNSSLSDVRISPDGKTIAYVLGGKLYLRDLDALQARVIEDSRSVNGTFWSPDSSQIGYYSERTLWRVPVEGGKPTMISQVGGVNSTTWGAEQTIFFNNFGKGVSQVSARGGEATITIPSVDDVHYHDIAALPGGRGLVIVVHGGSASVDTLALWAGGELVTLLQIDEAEIEDPIYAAGGHILFSRTRRNVGVWALPFSIERLEVTGDPFLAVPQGYEASASDDGTLVSTNAGAGREAELSWLDASGEVQGTIGQPQDVIILPALSPDGTRVAVTGRENTEWDVWIHDIESGTKTPLTFAEGFDGRPVWSADGESVLFSNRKSSAIYRVAADGSGEPESIIEGLSPTLSADNTRMVFVRDGEDTENDLWTLDLEGGSDPTVFLQTDADEHSPALSPDGRFVAYVSNVSGNEEVYVKQHPGGHGRWQASVNGGNSPGWSPSGDGLYFISGDNLIQVSFNASPNVVLGAPEVVANGRTSGFFAWASPTLAPDGRFIVSRNVQPEDEEDKPDQGIHVVENWLADFVSN